MGQSVHVGTYFDGQFVLLGRNAAGREGSWVGDGAAWQRSESDALAAMTPSHLITVGGTLVAFGWHGGPDPACAVETDQNVVQCVNAHRLDVVVSSDGLTWTHAPQSTLDLFGHSRIEAAAGGANAALAFGFQCDAAGRCTTHLWKSVDGLTWTGTEFPGDRPIAYPAWDIRTIVAPPAGGFIAVGGDGTEGWVSSDGENWTEVVLPAGAGRGEEAVYYAAAGPVAIVSSGCPPYVATSSHGLYWDRTNAVPDICAATGGDTSGLVGLSGPGTTLWKSLDGKTWSKAGTLAPPASFRTATLVTGPSGVLVALDGFVEYVPGR